MAFLKLNSEFWLMLNRWALTVFFVSLPFAPALGEISFVAALISWCAYKGMTRNYGIPLSPALKIPLAAYSLWVLASIFLSEYPSHSIRGFFKIFQQVTVFLMVAESFSTSHALSRFEKIIIVSFLLFVFDGFFQYAFGIDFLRSRKIHESFSGFRVCGPYKTYGLYACYLLTCVFYVITLLHLRLSKNKSQILKWVPFYVAIAASILIFYTRSRGAMLAGVLTLFMMVIYMKKWRWFLGLILLSGIGFLMMPRTMVFHFDKYYKEQSIFERFDLWNRAVQVIEAKPLTGTGINTYSAAHAKYDKAKSKRVQNYYAHSGYLQMAAEIGLPGLFLFLWFIGAYFFWSLARLKTDNGLRGSLLAGLLSFLIYALSDTIMHNDQTILMFWFFLGLQMAYVLLSEKTASIQKS